MTAAQERRTEQVTKRALDQLQHCTGKSQDLN
jgi:hypothetical protein